MELLKTIGITANQSKSKSVQVAERLVHLLEERGAEVLVDNALAMRLERPDLGLELERFTERVQLVFVLGGDGTLLGVARRFAAAGLPILGFNLGQLGFLSEAEPDDLSMAVDRVLNEDYTIEQRLMIEAEVLRGNEVVETGIALNDIGISKGSFGRMIQCTAYMDGMFLGTYSGDGLIVSTPTGSTAYSLSCGGPIVYPGIQVLLLTPICPHTLTSRPMVLPAEAVLEIHVSAVHREMAITIDGQIGYCLKEGDVVRVKRSRTPAHLIKWQDRSFFEVVRKKLQGESVDSRVGGK